MPKFFMNLGPNYGTVKHPYYLAPSVYGPYQDDLAVQRALSELCADTSKQFLVFDGQIVQVAPSPLEKPEDQARKHWATLMSALGDPKGSEVVLKDLLVRYGESHRGYHNLTHIVAMLDELELLGKWDQALVLAIWFHDAVYDPKAKDNEKQSAKLAKDTIKQIGLPDELGEVVHDLVMDTRHYAIPTGYLAQVLVDLDLMIFGKSAQEYDEYEAGIHKEYEWVPQLDFFRARSAILQSFLDRPWIYSTGSFQDKYERAARQNLKRSIEKMRQ